MMNNQDTHAGGAAGSGKAAAHDQAFKELRQLTPQEFDIRIAADGSWYHEGGLIGRPALVKLFSTVLRREADGSYWLVTPVERGRIEVEDAPVARPTWPASLWKLAVSIPYLCGSRKRRDGRRRCLSG